MVHEILFMHHSLLYAMKAGDGQFERSFTEDEIVMDNCPKDIYSCSLLYRIGGSFYCTVAGNWQCYLADLPHLGPRCVSDYQVFIVHSKHLLPQSWFQLRVVHFQSLLQNCIFQASNSLLLAIAIVGACRDCLLCDIYDSFCFSISPSNNFR